MTTFRQRSANLARRAVSPCAKVAVNGEVAKVLLTLSNNKHLTIHPKSPSERLRRKVVWLRNVRYFVEYYPPEGFVTGVATFNASGVLLYRDKSFEGF